MITGNAGQGKSAQGKLAQLIATRGGKAAPEEPFTIEHREALIYMLCEASELEHGIMCQYLFAAFSLKQSLDEGGLSADELAAVTRWRKQISHVATQEMLHLALVNNILSAIGAAPHLSRVNLPALANHYPAGVQLTLLPFGEQALRHFMFLERPEGMDLADAAGMTALGRAEPLMAEHDIVPRSQDFATVGHLYRSIEAGLGHLAEKFGERALFAGPPRAQATPASFRWPELIPVTSLASARRAVEEILEQGEGPRGAWQDAHFGQFVAILDEYQAMKAANPSFDPVRPVLAVNVRPLEHADVPLVTDTLTASCMDLFNVAYEVLLQALERYFAHTEETDAQLAELAELTLGLMFRVIKPLGDLIPTLPAGPEYPGRTAAPSFELFYESDYLMPHRGAAWALLEERLREAAAFARRCQTHRAAGGPRVASVLGTVGDAFEEMAGSLAAHFAEWGAVSRFAGRSGSGSVPVPVPVLVPVLVPVPGIDVAGLLAQAGSFAADAAGGPYAGLAADVHALACSAQAGGPRIARLVSSVLRPLAGASGGSGIVPVSGDGGGTTAERLRALAVAAARSRAGNPDPALQEANAALQDLAIAAAPDPAALLTELRSIQAGLAPGIAVAADGPYLVTNAERLRDWLGAELPARPQLALCRCGQSAIKPLCDGSHAASGFSGDKDPKRVPDHRDTYPGQQVTIFDNRGICQHAGFCTDRLASVFHAGGEPFVTASGGRLDEIVAAVRACPSGALSLAIDGTEQRAAADWHGTREPAIEVSKDGPYRITGGLPLTGGEGEDLARAEGSSREHYALCRCGHSQNKPFCSGMHWYVGFADPAPSERPTLFEWAGGLTPLSVLAGLFFDRHVPGDPVLGPLYASAPPGLAARAAARIAAAFGGPRSDAEGGGLAGGAVPPEASGRWITLWLRCADEARLPADPQFRSAFAAYVAWECAAPPESDVPVWDWGVAGPPPPPPPPAAAGADTAAGDVAEAEPALPGPDETVSFERHIKPLFRDKDRKSMTFAFDLWSYADVAANAAGILDRIRAGTMPCDGAWPAAKVDVFRRWTESNMLE